MERKMNSVLQVFYYIMIAIVGLFITILKGMKSSGMTIGIWGLAKTTQNIIENEEYQWGKIISWGGAIVVFTAMFLMDKIMK